MPVPIDSEQQLIDRKAALVEEARWRTHWESEEDRDRLRIIAAANTSAAEIGFAWELDQFTQAEHSFRHDVYHSEAKKRLTLCRIAIISLADAQYRSLVSQHLFENEALQRHMVRSEEYCKLREGQRLARSRAAAAELGERRGIEGEEHLVRISLYGYIHLLKQRMDVEKEEADARIVIEGAEGVAYRKLGILLTLGADYMADMEMRREELVEEEGLHRDIMTKAALVEFQFLERLAISSTERVFRVTKLRLESKARAQLELNQAAQRQKLMLIQRKVKRFQTDLDYEETTARLGISTDEAAARHDLHSRNNETLQKHQRLTVVWREELARRTLMREEEQTLRALRTQRSAREDQLRTFRNQRDLLAVTEDSGRKRLVQQWQQGLKFVLRYSAFAEEEDEARAVVELAEHRGRDLIYHDAWETRNSYVQWELAALVKKEGRNRVTLEKEEIADWIQIEQRASIATQALLRRFEEQYRARAAPAYDPRLRMPQPQPYLPTTGPDMYQAPPVYVRW
eukprot:TRINITY_DN43004_c0_g1_i1.p1 TRINITY_DN43004_c0_g1~~TRINITY_DN43004_c0_g1_i1.p1  ORF type:complete len:514 (+),score=106.05 TRINITY_DN43004_c0_g1_i1:34-1575(+)